MAIFSSVHIFTLLNYVVADKPVTAWKDIWLIGDQFVHNIYHTLQQMNTTATVEKKNAPYIYEMYNICCFTANPLSELKNVVACLVNALIKARNDAEKLPRIIMVLLDWDLVKYIGFKHVHTKIIFSEVLDWIINNMKRAVQSKRDHLMRKKAGAVTDNDPKIIWVKMINRFGDGNFKKNDPMLRALSQKGKFNHVLEDRLTAEQAHYVMDVNMAVNDGKYFTAANQLNGDGRVAYWVEITEQIQLFDFRRITLKPLRKMM